MFIVEQMSKASNEIFGWIAISPNQPMLLGTYLKQAMLHHTVLHRYNLKLEQRL